MLGLRRVSGRDILGEDENAGFPHGGKMLVKRFAFRVARNGVVRGKCQKCGEKVQGVW
jgi:hypothetical protein